MKTAKQIINEAIEFRKSLSERDIKNLDYHPERLPDTTLARALEVQADIDDFQGHEAHAAVTREAARRLIALP